MDRRAMNMAIFQDTTAMIDHSERLLADVANTRREQKLFCAGVDIPDGSSERKQEARIVVSEKRTLEAASAYQGKKTCILNFASATNPGGGVVNGASAQEESLCRCSTLYFCLNVPELRRDFYEPHRFARDPLYNDDILYSPNVDVIKTDVFRPERMKEADWYRVNVITCAAPNLRERPSNHMNPNAGDKPAKITEAELERLLESRIRRIFAVAAGEGNDVLILGAFGCGAFWNPPRVVARVFGRITKEYRNKFDVIEYAVYHTERETENFRAFQEEFQGL